MVLPIAGIISQVRLLVTLPPDDTLFSTDDYLVFINNCLLEEVYPRVIEIRSDYFLTREVFNLRDDANENLYPNGLIPIPARAWGNTLREIRYIDNSGNYYKLNPYFMEDLYLYQYRNLSLSASYTKGFIVNNNGVQLVPPPLNDDGSIEMYYILTPSVLVDDTTFAADIYDMEFNSLTNVYTCSVQTSATAFYAYCALNATKLFDVFNKNTGMLLAINLPLERTGASTFTGTSTVQDGTGILYPNITELTRFQPGGYPVAGDGAGIYPVQLQLVPAGQNAFTPLTNVMDKLLVYLVAEKVLEAQGYIEELQIFEKKYEKLKRSLLSQMAMRVENEPYVIKNTRGIARSVIFGGTRRTRI